MTRRLQDGRRSDCPLSVALEVFGDRWTLLILRDLLFKRKEEIVVNKLAKKVDQKYKELSGNVTVGSLVKLKKNYQVGEVKEIRGKRAIVQVGQLPMNVDMADLIAVEKIDTPNGE